MAYTTEEVLAKLEEVRDASLDKWHYIVKEKNFKVKGIGQAQYSFEKAQNEIVRISTVLIARAEMNKQYLPVYKPVPKEVVARRKEKYPEFYDEFTVADEPNA